MIEIRGGMTQNDLAGALTNLMINWLHMGKCWSRPDFRFWNLDRGFGMVET
jgi:hypothetical protein